MTGSDVIDKIMSLSPEEFHRSMAVLDPARPPSTVHRFECSGGVITINFVSLPSVRLGDLLALPRARVTLRFDDVAPAARTEFLSRFDLAFQRGGG